MVELEHHWPGPCTVCVHSELMGKVNIWCKLFFFFTKHFYELCYRKPELINHVLIVYAEDLVGDEVKMLLIVNQRIQFQKIINIC